MYPPREQILRTRMQTTAADDVPQTARRSSTGRATGPRGTGSTASPTTATAGIGFAIVQTHVNPCSLKEYALIASTIVIRSSTCVWRDPARCQLSEALGEAMVGGIPAHLVRESAPGRALVDDEHLGARDLGEDLERLDPC